MSTENDRKYPNAVPKRPLIAIRSWYRQAVVIAAVGVVVVIGAVAFILLQSAGGKDQNQARLLSGTSDTVGVSGGLTADASARGLRLCNRTPSRVGVAIGYKEDRQWITEGWWNVAKDSCETLVAGALVSRFYYVYAVDYDQGGVWGGKAVMCTRDKMFTIRGIEDCVTRGYERSGFFEVDTGEQKSWTVQLTAPGQPDASAGTDG